MSFFNFGHVIAEVLAIIFIDKVKTTSHKRISAEITATS